MECLLKAQRFLVSVKYRALPDKLRALAFADQDVTR